MIMKDERENMIDFHLTKALELMKGRIGELEQENKQLARLAGDRWLNQAQAARYLGYSDRHVRRLRDEGLLVFRSGKILRSQLDKFVQNYSPRRAQKMGVL